MKKHLFLVIPFFVLMVCGCGKGRSDELKLVIGYIPHIQFTPIYVAEDLGLFKKNNISLKTDYGFGLDAFSMILTGKVDFTLSDSDQLIVSASKGYKLTSFYQYYKHYPVSIVARDNIKNIADLKDKSIGVPELYGTSYIGLNEFLRINDLLDKVNVIKIGYNQIPSLLNNKVDAVVCFYNNEPIALKEKGENIVEWKVEDYSQLTGASFITSEENYKNKIKSFEAFKKAITESMHWIDNNYDEAVNIAYKHIPGLKIEDKPFWKKVLIRTVDLCKDKNEYGVPEISRYSNTVDILYKSGAIEKIIDVKSVLADNK